MKNFISKLKTDLYNVFVQGNADQTQMARVFILLAVPTILPLLIFAEFPVY